MLVVLALNTVFGTLLMSPIWVGGIADGTWGLGGTLHGHMLILIKSVIVLSSWVLGYFAIKHLPLTIQGPINASRPVLVLVGAMLIFGERLNWLQWVGVIIGFASLFFISRIGGREGFSMRNSCWLWMSIGATMLGAVSALYDKYLLRSLPAFRRAGLVQPVSVYSYVRGGGHIADARPCQGCPQGRALFVAVEHTVDICVSHGGRFGLFLFAVD